MLRNTFEEFGMYPWKQLYFIAFVDLVPVATEKVSLIRSNIIWNRWKSTYSEGKIYKSEPEPGRIFSTKREG